MNRLIQISITAFLCFSCACLSAQSLELNDLLVREGVLVTGTDGSVTNTSLLQIRGANALRGSSEPLIILDGAVLNPYLLETGNAFWQYSEAAYNNVQNSLMGLNPADIERIEVLRDLSATALYGQAGANGVIIITTKMASEREHRITWSSHLELSTPVLGKTPMRGLEEGANALSTAAGPSLSHRHDFSVSARRNKLNYLFSGFLHDVNGTLEGNGATVGGLRVNFDVNANKTLSFGMRMGVSLADTDAGLYAGRVGTGTGSIAMLTTAADSTEPDAYASWRSDYDDHAREYRAMPSMWINIKFLEGLNLRTEAGADYRDKSRAFWYGNGLSFGRAHNGAAAVSSFTTLSYNASSALCLDKQWGAHALVMKAGVDAYGYFDNQNTLNGTDFFAHELRAKGLNLAGSKAQLHAFTNELFRYGAYALARYDVKQAVGFEALYRRDFCPQYQDGDRPHYAARLWWDVAKAFSLPSEALSSLKLEAHYGTAGKLRVVPFDLFGGLLSMPYPTVDPNLAIFHYGTQLYRSEEKALHLDASLWKDRLTLGLAAYEKTTDEVTKLYCEGEAFGQKGFYQYTDPQELFSTPAALLNRGLEASLSVKLLDKKDLSWMVLASANLNRNRILRLDNANQNGRNTLAQDYTNVNVAGLGVASFYGYRVESVDAQGNVTFADLTGDGVVNAFDKTVIGDPNIGTYGLLGSQLRAGAFSMDLYLDYALDFDVLNLHDVYGASRGGVNWNVVSSRMVERGDFVRLRNLNFAYAFPLRSHKVLETLSVKLNMHNLITVSRYGGWSPDVSCFGTDNATLGIDYGSVPMSRSFSLGISATF